LTKSLAQNLVDGGFRVNCVVSGPIWTPLNVAEKAAPKCREPCARRADEAAG
jgi:NAD(P)-dependent dehydrogenase (short-subunit alcohol dehydrogenase family)